MFSGPLAELLATGIADDPPILRIPCRKPPKHVFLGNRRTTPDPTNRDQQLPAQQDMVMTMMRPMIGAAHCHGLKLLLVPLDPSFLWILIRAPSWCSGRLFRAFIEMVQCCPRAIPISSRSAVSLEGRPRLLGSSRVTPLYSSPTAQLPSTRWFIHHPGRGADESRIGHLFGRLFVYKDAGRPISVNACFAFDDGAALGASRTRKPQCAMMFPMLLRSDSLGNSPNSMRNASPIYSFHARDSQCHSSGVSVPERAWLDPAHGFLSS